MKLHKDMQKHEIEEAIKNEGDFVKIDHLTRLLKERISTDVKKFVYLKLGEIYERRYMFVYAAESYDRAGENSIAYAEKRKCFMKEAELFIKAGEFFRADEAMKKAMREANVIEKNEIKTSIKNFYKKQGEELEKGRKSSAIKIYEKLLEMELSDLEKKEVKERLIKLYESLGKVKEYFTVKRGLEEK